MNYFTKTILFLVLLSVFGTQKSFASHAVGIDLTYEHIFNNIYSLTLTLYRDCSGIQVSSNANVHVSSATCLQEFWINLPLDPTSGQELPQTCYIGPTTCSGGNHFGVQEWIYRGLINLPANCVDWEFDYVLCCRNNAINTIFTPGASTIYVVAMLNNTIIPKNNSPVFSNKPVPFLCVGEPFCYNQGAYDVDGDSLVYSLEIPMQNSYTPVNYIPGYSETNFINTTSGINFNSLTGDICLTPSSPLITVFSVRVKEYRNGVLIGSVERDMQLIAQDCNCNPLPVEFGSFEIYDKKTYNQLEWMTLSEINNDKFVVERSFDERIDFMPIGSVNGVGNSTEMMFYHFEDYDNINKGYYRIKQIDYDGKESFSEIRYLNKHVNDETILKIVLYEYNMSLINSFRDYTDLYNYLYQNKAKGGLYIIATHYLTKIEYKKIFYL